MLHSHAISGTLHNSSAFSTLQEAKPFPSSLNHRSSGSNLKAVLALFMSGNLDNIR